MPYDGAYPITQYFGESPKVYQPLGYIGHHGVDIGLPMRTLVRCSLGGTVVLSGRTRELPGAGIYVVVKHDDRYSTVYMHLAEVAVHRGDVVEVGHLLGYSGNTGLSTGPHLHWGLRDFYQMDNGYQGYVNPLERLKD